MRKLAFALAAAALLSAVSLSWNAEATIVSAASQIRAAVHTVKPVTNAACRGTGAHCPPGYVWNGRRCVPC